MKFPAILDLVPHKPPMALLDEVRDWAPPTVTCAVTVRADSLFAESGAVQSVVALEYMAQAAAVYAGLRGRENGDAVRIGYLLGTRHLALDVDSFATGDELLVTASHVWGDDKLGNFDCTVSRGGRVVATATLNVYSGPLSGASA